MAAVERAETLAERTDTAQRAWLRAVAAHKVADHYRRGYARPQISLEEVAETLFADETQTPEYTALQCEQDDRLWTLLEQLPRLSQQVIHLRFVYDLSCAEIAEALGKREGAFALDRWHTDQLRAQNWEQEWTPRLMEAPAVLLIGEPFGRPPPQPAVAPARA